MTEYEARRRVGPRRSRPAVEGLESRRLLTLSISEYPFPNALPYGGAPFNSGITAGPGGVVWFTGVDAAGRGEIGAYSPTTHATALFPLPAGVRAGAIAAGPDGNLYFAGDTGPSADAIGVFNPTTRAAIQFPTPTPGSRIGHIAVAADGTVWFTESATYKVGSFNPTTRAFREYPVATRFGSPMGIVIGPDGGVWFTESDFAATADVGPSHGKIGRIDPATGAFAEHYAAPGISPGLTAGRDGRIWFGTSDAKTLAGNAIAAIDPATGAIASYPTGLISVVSLAAGADGRIDFLGQDSSKSGPVPSGVIGQFDPATHALTATAAPVSGEPMSAAGLVALADGRLDYLSLGLAGPAAIGPGLIGEATPIPAGYAALAGTLAAVGTSAAGRVVYVDVDGDGRLGAGDPSTVSGPYGDFAINGVPAGTHAVRVVTSAGEAAAAPTVAFVAGQVQAAGPTVLAASPILPLAASPSPFGAHNPDLATAEVNGLYSTILGRAPDPVGLNAAVAYLRAGGSPQLLASILLHCDEYEGRLVAADYANILGRAAAPSEVAAWVKVIDQQRLSAEQVAYYFMTSAGFNAAHADTASFVTAVYRNVLGRPATAAEVAAWAPLLGSASSRGAMVYDMIHSAFAAQKAVEGFAAIFWGGALNVADEAYVVAYLVNGGTQADVASAFASLPRFVGRAGATVG